MPIILSRNPNKRILQLIKRMETKELYIKNLHGGGTALQTTIGEAARGGIEPSTETLCPIDSYSSIDLGAQEGDIDDYSVTGVYRTPNDTAYLRVGAGVWIAEVFMDTGVVKAKVFNSLNFSVLVTLYVSGPGTGELVVVVPLYLNHSTVISSTLLSDGNDAVLVDATISTVTLTLPPAADVEGKVLTIKKTDGSVNIVTVDGDGTETLDGALTYVLQLQYDTVTIISDGANWHIMSFIETGI